MKKSKEEIEEILDEIYDRVYESVSRKAYEVAKETREYDEKKILDELHLEAERVIVEELNFSGINIDRKELPRFRCI